MSSGVGTIVPSTTDLELEAWWEKFIAEKRKDDAQDEDTRQQWDNFATRKLKFIREFRILTDLYEPTAKVVNSILSNDYAHRGQQLYAEWCKVGKKECLLAYYDTPVFRAIYTNYRFLSSATSFLQALVERLIPEHPDLETYLLQSVCRVITVGVGPGSDIAAFLAYIRCRGVNSRLVYYAIDQSEGWSSFLSAFDRYWSMVHNISIWFKSWRFGKRDDVACLPDADMVVFSFSNTTLMDKAIWPLLIQRYKFILVLDGMKDRVVTNLGSAGFSDFRLSEKTTVYYYFSGLQESQTNIITEAAEIPSNSAEAVSTEPKE